MYLGQLLTVGFAEEDRRITENAAGTISLSKIGTNTSPLRVTVRALRFDEFTGTLPTSMTFANLPDPAECECGYINVGHNNYI